MTRSFGLVLILTAVLAACTGGSGSLGTLSPAESAQPSVALGSPDIVPQPSQPSPSDPSTSPALPSGSPQGTTILRAYFVLAGPQGSAGLVPVLRDVPATAGVARAAMTALLTGPNPKEASATRSISTTIPAGTQLLGEITDRGKQEVIVDRILRHGRSVLDVRQEDRRRLIGRVEPCSA